MEIFTGNSEDPKWALVKRGASSPQSGASEGEHKHWSLRNDTCRVGGRFYRWGAGATREAITMADAPPLLYVEDDPLISMAVSMALEDAGFDVVHVMDGKAAVAALADRAIEFCALATDVRLPDVDGWEIAHQARALKPSIPVVYVSGDSAADWSARGVPNSIMVQKPFANAQLVAAITTLLNDAS